MFATARDNYAPGPCKSATRRVRLRIGVDGSPMRHTRSARRLGSTTLASLLLAAIGFLGAWSAAPTVATPFFGVRRTSDGTLSVVRFPANPYRALADDALLTNEPDTPVSAFATFDPRRPQQWAMNAVPYESVWPST